MPDECRHPDPKTVNWLFCRNCGYWVEGVRIADATDGVLKETLSLYVSNRTDTTTRQR